MDWYKSIKGWYNNGDGYWTKEQVKDAVEFGKITPEQYKEITGDEYIEGSPPTETAPVSE
ncbi:XkdX family protein [Bacillus velezensis]